MRIVFSLPAWWIVPTPNHTLRLPSPASRMPQNQALQEISLSGGGLTAPPPLSDGSMASLALDQEQRPAAERTSRGSGDLIDARAITADLEKLAKAHTGNERDLRS